MERFGLCLGHGRAFHQRRREALQSRGRDLRRRPGGKEGRAKSRDLRFRKAGHHRHRADALDDFAQAGRGGVHIVRQMVDGIGERISARQCQVHACPPVSHHLARLIAGQIEGDAHFCRLLGKFGQVLLCDAGLPCSRNDGGDAARRHRYPPGHVHDLFGHGLKLGLRLEVHNLCNIGHRTLKFNRRSRRQTKGPEQ